MSDPQAPYQRAMVVVAHADDAEYGCSGTVAKWCREGIEVVYVICTDGSKGSDNLKMTSSRLARIRRREQEEAGKVLGLSNVVFLDYEDAMLQPTLTVRSFRWKEEGVCGESVFDYHSAGRNLAGRRPSGVVSGSMVPALFAKRALVEDGC